MHRLCFLLLIIFFSSQLQALDALDLKNSHRIFKRDYRQYSPVMAMMFKETILPQLRFHGNYGPPHSNYPYAKNMPLVRLESDCPQDPVAAFIQYLFPSFETLGKLSCADIDISFSVLGKLVDYLATHRGFIHERELKEILEEGESSSTLVTLLCQSHEFLIRNKVYPNHIIEHAFTTFFLMKASTRADLKVFLSAMPHLVDQTLIEHFNVDKSYTKADFIRAKKGVLRNPMALLDPEDTVLLLSGHQEFDTPLPILETNFCKQIKEKTDAEKNEARLRQFAQEVLNLFIFLLYDSSEGKPVSDQIETIEAKHNLTLNRKFKAYFKKFASAESWKSEAGRVSWLAFIRSNFVRFFDPQTAIGSFELHFNLYKTLTLIFNSPALQEKLSKLEKYTKLYKTSLVDVQKFSPQLNTALQEFWDVMNILLISTPARRNISPYQQICRFEREGNVPHEAQISFHRGDIKGQCAEFTISRKKPLFLFRKDMTVEALASYPVWFKRLKLKGDFFTCVGTNRLAFPVLLFYEKQNRRLEFEKKFPENPALVFQQLCAFWKQHPQLFPLFFFSNAAKLDLGMMVRYVLKLGRTAYAPFCKGVISRSNFDENEELLVELLDISLEYPNGFLKEYDLITSLESAEKKQLACLTEHAFSLSAKYLIKHMIEKELLDLDVFERACRNSEYMMAMLAEVPTLIPLLFRRDAWISFIYGGQEGFLSDVPTTPILLLKINFFFEKLLQHDRSALHDKDFERVAPLLGVLLDVCATAYGEASPLEQKLLEQMINHLSNYTRFRLCFAGQGVIERLYRFGIGAQNYDILRRLIFDITAFYESEAGDEQRHQQILSFITEIVSPVALFRASENLYEKPEEMEAYVFFIQGISKEAWKVLGTWFLGRGLKFIGEPVFVSDHFGKKAFQAFKNIAYCTDFKRLTDDDRSKIYLTIDLFPDVVAKQIRKWMVEHFKAAI